MFAIKTLYNLVPQRIVAISDSVYSYLIDIGVKNHKLKLIVNGIDYEGLRNKYSRPKPKHRLALVVLARLEPVKAINNLLRALSRIEQEGKLWDLRIIGDGSQRYVLEKQARKLGILNKVDFVGVQQEPMRYLQDRSAICIPSYREGLPIALLEALSVGLPAVVSDVSFLPAVVSNGKNGFVCKSGSVDSLMHCLHKLDSLSSTQWNQFSDEAQKSVKSYDIKTCVKKYQEIINSVIAIKRNHAVSSEAGHHEV
jgi:glycosyltransferase involved in cell wall biosynthesis